MPYSIKMVWRSDLVVRGRNEGRGEGGKSRAMHSCTAYVQIHISILYTLFEVGTGQ